MRGELRVVAGILVLVSWLGQSRAEIPTVISYQGKVTDASGNPVADGSYTMRFRIYNVSSGGSPLWDSGARTVTLAGGIFSVLLGETPQPALNLAFDADYWLLVTFAGVDQTPRQRLASVGYAYMASGLVAGTEVSGSLASNVLTVVNSSSAADASALRAASTAGSGYTHGVYAEVSSPDGSAVLARGTSGTGNAYGVYAQSLSTSGTAIYGQATATSGTTHGVYGISSSTAGTGVCGYVSAISGNPYGVWGISISTAGVGVRGQAVATTGLTYGVCGLSYATSGRGVYGGATATSGTTYGVYGESASTHGRGVYGGATATSGTTHGGWFESASTYGRGVYGGATATSGETHGGWFESASTYGRGVSAYAFATSGTIYGVFGWNGSPAGYAVYYSGNLGGTGTKSCVVKTSKGPTLLYCQESPENWFEDFGEGRLVNGRCRIELDPVFLETVTINAANPMKVYVTPNGRLGEWWVEKGATAFDLVAPEAPGGSRFDYRVVAKRKGFEGKRLDVCEAARTDSYLYPELREKELRELQQERIRHDDEHARLEQERARLEAKRLRQREAPERLSLITP